jgi:hypothetical protein
VRLAIDTLSDDIPPVIVEVQAEGRIVVTPYHLAAQQEQQMRAALERIGGVTVLPAPDGVRAPRANRGPATAADLIIDSSQAVAAQAHLLSQLERRFDAAVEAALSTSDRKSLAEMRARHAGRMLRDIGILRNSLEQDRPGFAGSTPATEAAGGEVSIAEVLEAATAMNRLITKVYATADPDAHASSQRLAAALSQLRQLSVKYARHLGAEAVP